MKSIALAWTMLLGFAGSAIAAPPPILQLTVPFEGPMALAVLDARPDVINGERKETFIGRSSCLRGHYNARPVQVY